MINEELELDDANPDLYIFRAKLNLLFGNVRPLWSLASSYFQLSLLFFYLQNTQCYYDLCSALDISADHAEALRMKAELEEKAVDCKNQVYIIQHVIIIANIL